MIQGMNLLNWYETILSHIYYHYLLEQIEYKLYYVYAMISQHQLSIIANQLSLDTNTYDFEYF